MTAHATIHVRAGDSGSVEPRLSDPLGCADEKRDGLEVVGSCYWTHVFAFEEADDAYIEENMEALPSSMRSRH